MTNKPRIAHFSGDNATIQNTPPLVTSNKARMKYGLPPLGNADDTPARFDVLRPQRLAASATVYVEQFSAHPMERDAAELYGAPDGFLDVRGQFHKERQSPADKPVYEVVLDPDDGLYPLPYMGLQKDGRAWEEDSTDPFAPAERARQSFFPDGARLFEEIDRLGVGHHGHGNSISAFADVDFYRAIPAAGYTKGLSATERTDCGQGDIAPEERGRDFFSYRPYHLAASVPRPGLARITNVVQGVLASGKYEGGIWMQGSPRIEETSYWLNLLLDVIVPLCSNAAQRTHGEVSNDGPRNIIDTVQYITSRVWEDEAGKNRAGVVLIQEQQIFAARDVQKGDARPGGYITTGGHGGIIGAVGHEGPPTLTYLPTTRHTHRSDVNISRLPAQVDGVQRRGDTLVSVTVRIKDGKGSLLETAIPKVAIIKDGTYHADGYDLDPEREVDIKAIVDYHLAHAPLSGFVIEGLSPYGFMTSRTRHLMMRKAALTGMPVVRVGRGNNEGFSAPRDVFLGGRNLTATKARLLLMACLMRYGALPPARDPNNPTDVEMRAIRTKLDAYQAIFDTH